MAKKTVKKVDVKAVAKAEVSAVLEKALKEAGFEVVSGDLFGFTKGTLVAHHAATDVQVKLITPKAGVERYAVAEDEDETVEVTVETETAEVTA